MNHTIMSLIKSCSNSSGFTKAAYFPSFESRVDTIIEILMWNLTIWKISDSLELSKRIMDIL